MSISQDLHNTIQQIAATGKGILAADESTATIEKRLKTIHVESTEENRRAYRDLLLSTPNLHEFISGVILFEETLGQKSHDGTPFPELLENQGILPGIKVDKGLINLENSTEKTTQGLDGLGERLAAYKDQGAKFAKWRAVYAITDHLPSCLAMTCNAYGLARYAATCQAQGIVPIVEPEVLMDGGHTIERCFEVTEAVLKNVFQALYEHNVSLEHIVLKPSMAISGANCPQQASTEEIAEKTVTMLRRTVPAAVPTINFLSGGQSAEFATANLNAMNQMAGNPWQLSFSYGRALQAPTLAAWQGEAANTETAQALLYQRAKLNAAATLGKYTAEME